MRPDNTRFLIQAARQRSQATRQRAIQAFQELAATGTPVTFETVARAAGVSCSWLYGQSDLRGEIHRLRALTTPAPSSPPVPARQRASDASLRRRLLATNAELRQLRDENRQLRGQLARALGARRAAATRPSKHNGSVRSDRAHEGLGSGITLRCTHLSRCIDAGQSSHHRPRL